MIKCVECSKKFKSIKLLRKHILKHIVNKFLDKQSKKNKKHKIKTRRK